MIRVTFNDIHADDARWQKFRKRRKARYGDDTESEFQLRGSFVRSTYPDLEATMLCVVHGIGGFLVFDGASLMPYCCWLMADAEVVP